MNEIARYFIRPDEQGPGLWCLGYGSKRERVDCGPRTLTTFGAVYVRAGTGHVETSATHGTLAIGPGTLFWQFPGVAHVYGPDHGGWHERWLLFDGPMAAAFLERGFLDPANPLLVDCPPTVVRILNRVEDAVRERGPFAAMTAAAEIHQLIVHSHRIAVMGDGQSSPGTGTNADADRGRRPNRGARPIDLPLSALVDRLEREAFGPIDLVRVAHELGMGSSTFRRHFRALTGSSPKSYVLALRLARAKERLAESDAPIATIAAEIGFDDPYYFSRLFRAREGRSPSAFRLEHRRTGLG